MALYWDILSAVKNVLQELDVLEGKTITIRRLAATLPLQELLRNVVVCSNESLAERVAELTFDNRAYLEFDVYVLFPSDMRWDAEDTQYRMGYREDVRLALWKPLLAGVDEVFDCDYDPDPGVPAPANPNMLLTAQLFTYKANVPRADE
jgi:hypothetical protein